MKLKNLIQTCGACPSQWEALLDDGRGVYIRYRWGYISVYVSNNPDEHGLEGLMIHSAQLGDEFDGSLSQERMLSVVNNIKNKQAVNMDSNIED